MSSKFAKGVFALVRLSLCDVTAIADLASLAMELGTESFVENVVSGGISAVDVIDASLQVSDVAEAANEVNTAARELQETKDRKLPLDQAERRLANAKKHGGEALVKYYQIKTIFDLIDLDGGGSISQREFKMFIVLFNTVENISVETCAEVFAAIDTDGSGEIDLKELYSYLMNNERILHFFQLIADAIVRAYNAAKAALPAGAAEASIFALFIRRLRIARRGTPFSFERNGKYWNRICDPISAGPDGNFYCNRKWATAAAQFTCTAGGRTCKDCAGITTMNVEIKKIGRKNCPRSNHPMRLQGVPNESGIAIYRPETGYLCDECGKGTKELGMSVRWFCIDCGDCDICLNCAPNDCFVVPTMRRCPQKHEMQILAASIDAYNCDVCRNAIKKSEPKWGCADCDYDMCFSCAVKCELNNCFNMPTMRRCPQKHEMKILTAAIDGYNCDVCSNAIKKSELKWGCAGCNYDECFTCSALPRKCPQRHEMRILAAAIDGYNCDVCSNAIKKSEPKWGCAGCNYDMCLTCTA